MAYSRTYNLFISHSWKYSSEYNRFVDLLDNAWDFKWKNYSVSIDDPCAGGSKKKLANEIESQIKLASAVIIISGMYVVYREWIQFEIDLADRYEKPILGVIPWGNERVPETVQNSAWKLFLGIRKVL